MPLIRKAYHDTPDGQLHYRYIRPNSGQQSVAIVFLHMSASSSASFERLLYLYADKGYSCFAPDMPGFGGSYDISRYPDTGYYVRTFVDIFNSLGLCDSGFHIVGHHSGACLGLEIAANYPEAVRSLCMIGPVVMTPNERVVSKERSMVPFNKPVPDGTHLLKTWEYCNSMGVGEDIDYWQVELLDHVRAWQGRLQIYNAVFSQDSIALVTKVQCPIQLMCARDDVLWPYVHRITDLRPEVDCREISGVNFEPHNAASEIAEVHGQFLASLS